MRWLVIPLLVLCHSFEARGIDAQQSDLYKISLSNNAYEQAVPMPPDGEITERRLYYFEKPPEPTLPPYELTSGSYVGISMGGYQEQDERKIGERRFYQNGKVAEEKLYRKGVLHGVWRQYHENGTLFSERPYRMGVPDGTFKFWNDKGKLLGQSVIKQGNGVLQEYELPEFHSRNRKIPFIDGKVDGPEVTMAIFSGDAEDAAGRSITNYTKGLREGWAIQYWSNKTLRSSAYLHEDKLHGVSRMLDLKGKMQAGYPRYFVSGQEVTEQEFVTAAKEDSLLQVSLNQDRPEKTD
ncbi:toxin-antitoxin system YwqK family antitoxin [Bythopirellula polymerisocia]|uniref:MORN repeat variant n=1 Tax=Bythopirellula polymerisocia TaxID=2528003 RepID=A0A5C6D4V8_9BACT|nr:hypothetical protein [Bythopirellula polymerisocia]TWU29909.1 MORN repeat variant [Bythopirellula polymerisocia]